MGADISEYVIETENIVKTYKSKRAVDNVNIHIRRGDIYGLIGKNGAGKTTLMKVILGLARPTDGKVKLFGSYNVNAGRKRIGSLIEAPGLFRGCSAYENMKRFAMLYGTDEKQIAPLLELVGLADTGKKKAGQFSLGMKQRLGIAIALLGDPEVLILDEPINGLDPAGIKEMRDLFLSLAAKGVTLMISSHLLDELAKVVTVYGIINDGKLVEEITVEELESRCATYVKFVTSDNEKAFGLMSEQSGFKGEIKGDAIYMYSDPEKSGKMNALLVSNGIEIYEMDKTNGGAEDYFIGRLGNE